MITIVEQGVNALGGTYPPGQTPPETNSLQADNKRLMDLATKLDNDLKGITTENDQLKKKLAATEEFIKLRYAEQIADAKIGRKMLKKDDRTKEIESLKSYSVDTLKVLSEELSKVQLNLSSDEPIPTAPPAQPPVQETPEQIMARDEKEMRLKLFGHEEPAEVFYQKQMEAKLNKKVIG